MTKETEALKTLARLGQEIEAQPAQERPWVGLTEEEIKAHWSQLWHDINQMKFASNDAPQKETVIFIFAKAIETKLKEKNTWPTFCT